MTTVRRVAVLAAALVGLSARPAAAQSRADAERAEKLFTEASALAAAGRYAEACPRFKQSQRLDSGLGTQFNLALCFEKLGELGSAWMNYRGVARLAHQTGKRDREDAALQKMEQLKRRVSRLVITAHDPDTTVKVDGEPIDHDAWSFFAVDAGDHMVEGTAPAKRTWRKLVTFERATGDGQEKQVAIPALVAITPETRVVTVTQETSNPRRTLGFVIGGVGLVGLGAGLVTGIILLNEKSIAEDRCQPRCADQGARDAISTGKTLAPINVIAWGVGIAGVGIGGLLLLTSGSGSSSTTARLSPTFGPGSGGANVVGPF